jgi:NADP-dependent 3-hydroxy acid dehydrogenase YdfG
MHSIRSVLVQNRWLKDKTAIVTGASSGIGKATAEALARQGVRVALAARRQAELEALAQNIDLEGGQAVPFVVDVTSQSQVAQMVKQVVDKWGRIDILVLNAGQYIRSQAIQVHLSLLEKSMAVNFYGGVYAILAALPHMIERGQGHIILVSTMDARRGLPLDAPYVAGKSALKGFVEVLRQEVREHGIAVTTIFPGRVDTPMIEDVQFHRISAKISAEAVARDILKATKNRRAEIIIPFHARFLEYANILSPELTDRIVKRLKLEGWKVKNSKQDEF